MEEIRKHSNHQATVLGMKNGTGLSRLSPMCPSICKIAWGRVGAGGGETTDSVNHAGYLCGY